MSSGSIPFLCSIQVTSIKAGTCVDFETIFDDYQAFDVDIDDNDILENVVIEPKVDDGLLHSIPHDDPTYMKQPVKLLVDVLGFNFSSFGDDYSHDGNTQPGTPMDWEIEAVGFELAVWEHNKEHIMPHAKCMMGSADSISFISHWEWEYSGSDSWPNDDFDAYLSYNGPIDINAVKPLVYEPKLNERVQSKLSLKGM